MPKFLRFAPLLALVALTLTALAQEGSQEGTAQQEPQLDELFVPVVADNDLYEIRSSELILERVTDDQEVVEFAQRMIDDHTANSQRLMELAGGMNVEMPQELSPANQAKIAELNALEGAELVQAYLLQQQLAHIDAITLFSAQAELGQNEELRAFAQEGLPILQEHLEMVQSMRDAREGNGN